MRNARVARYVALRRELDSLILEELEPWQLRVLEFVGEHSGASSGELVKGLGMDLTHAGTVLKQLTDLGLLRRTERRDASGRYFVYCKD